MNQKLEVKYLSNDIKMTAHLGERLAEFLPNGTVVQLVGDLGSGKTTLVGAVAKGLNIDEKVQSPTFNIMKVYTKGKRWLVHIDAYRLENANSDIGLEEFIGIEQGVTFIEWPIYISNVLPTDFVKIEIIKKGENSREFIIKSNYLDLSNLVL